MKKIIIILCIILSFITVVASAENWTCSQCGNAASGNFCNNCGISAEDSLASTTESSSLIGERITISDICEFIIEDVSFTNRLNPQNPAMFYSYYQADEGKIYLCCKLSYTNLQANTVQMDGFLYDDSLVTGELTFASKYKYNGFLCYEDTLGEGNTLSSGFIGSIDPLCTKILYYLIEVPNAVYESTEPVKLVLVIGQNEYAIDIR